MAKVRYFKNFIEDSFEEFDIEPGTTVRDCVEKYSSDNPYTSDFVECYDPETGKTWFAPFDEDDEGSVLVTINEAVVSPDYEIKEDDVVFIIYLPTSGPSGNAWLKGFVMAAVGTIYGAITGGLPGAIIGLVGGFAVGVLGTWYQEERAKSEVENKRLGKKSEGGKEVSKLPDVRGAENQPLINDVYPLLIGKHSISPFIVGNPITTYEGKLGRDPYISLLYCVGYGPLKITDIKLGDYMLAYNRSHGEVKRDTVLSGLLEGYSSGGVADNGDILDLWVNNNVSLEILQQAPGQLNRGDIYPTTKVDKAIDANCLYIVDKPLSDLAEVTYKGASFPTNFKTNNVYFTESFPKSFTITLTASEGLFASRSHTDGDGNSNVIYESIPLWYCVQWRPYSNTNSSSDSNGSDFDKWENIYFEGTKAAFTEQERKIDIAKHVGNTIEEVINTNFVGKKLCNFAPYSGGNYVTEMRFSQTIEIPDSIINKIVYDKNNTVHGIEVRILRVSPSYQNQRSSKGEYGPYSYSDIIGVKSICTEILDVEYYKKTGKARAVPAIPYDEDLKKFCYIAIKAKADLNGNITQSLGKMSCTAEAFTPYWESNEKKWYPEDVHKIIKYTGFYNKDTTDPFKLLDKSYRENHLADRVARSSKANQVSVTEEEYLSARKAKFNWMKSKAGSNFTTKIRENIFTTQDFRNRFVLTESGSKFLNQDSASNFLMAAIADHCGIVARGYEDLNLSSIGEWHDDIMEVTDGSTDENGELVKFSMESNGYVFKGVKLEILLAKIAATGRAVYTYDETGKIKVIMDKPALYPVGVINDQNCLSAQDSYDYNDIPAGLVISFPDENDGYETNNLYCWSDGNTFDNYKGQVKPYSIDYVTKPVQAWSLGRYMLANTVVGKQRLVRKIGMEGMIYTLGDVLMVQSDNLLVGDGSGRIQQVIEVGNDIFGFVSDSTYIFTGEFTEKDRSVQGVSIFQPKNMSRDKIITLPLAKPGFTVTVNTSNGGEVTYKQIVGTTNVILFDKPYPKYKINSKGEKCKTPYNISTGDICLFGDFDRTSAPYRIVKVKREGDNTFTETLLRYDESIYNYGAELPSFQSYVKTDPVPRDPISLSEVPSNILELNNSNKGNNELIEHQISKLYANRVINLYKKSKTLLVDTGITSNLTYDFTKNTIVWDDEKGTNGWELDYKKANANEGSMYFTSATAFGRDITDIIEPREWTAPIVFGANGANGEMGLNGLTIFMEKPAIAINADKDGNVTKHIIVDQIHVEMDGDPVPFTIGDIEVPEGMEIEKGLEDITITVKEGAEMAENGFIAVPINTKNILDRSYLSDEKGNRFVDELGLYYGSFLLGDQDRQFILYVSYVKARKGDIGEKGADGAQGEQGPSYLGYFEKPNPDFDLDILDKASVGSWFLSSFNGKIYVKNNNPLEPWVALPEPLDYSDPRVKECVNDMFELVKLKPQLDSQFSRIITLWVDNLVANDAFVDTLTANEAFIQKLNANKLNIRDVYDPVTGKISKGLLRAGERYDENGNLINKKSKGCYISTEGTINGTLVGDRKNVNIGENAGAALLFEDDVEGQVVDPITGKVVTTKLAGNGSWNVFIGEGSGQYIEGGKGNVLIGYDTSIDEHDANSSYNVLIGSGVSLRESKDISQVRGNVIIGNMTEENGILYSTSGLDCQNSVIIGVKSDNLYKEESTITGVSDCIIIGNDVHPKYKLPGQINIGNRFVADVYSGGISLGAKGDAFSYDGYTRATHIAGEQVSIGPDSFPLFKHDGNKPTIKGMFRVDGDTLYINTGDR